MNLYFSSCEDIWRYLCPMFLETLVSKRSECWSVMAWTGNACAACAVTHTVQRGNDVASDRGSQMFSSHRAWHHEAQCCDSYHDFEECPGTALPYSTQHQQPVDQIFPNCCTPCFLLHKVHPSVCNQHPDTPPLLETHIATSSPTHPCASCALLGTRRKGRGSYTPSGKAD